MYSNNLQHNYYDNPLELTIMGQVILCFEITITIIVLAIYYIPFSIHDFVAFLTPECPGNSL